MIRTTFLALGLVLGAVGLAPASAADQIGSYNAFLSSADHFNSNGERLTSAAAIIRQDRANFHKFGIRDDADEGDNYFANADNRAALERMLNDGASDPGVLSRIVDGNVMIHVDIFRSQRHGDYVVVTLLGRERSGY
ncbi:MAG TPA: hypothetical protein VNU97_17230 [Rhizomicrobium sp.]|jgi:hypothetical protein|nr:hypothetical protein [Rhizomicrobium sp.]